MSHQGNTAMDPNASIHTLHRYLIWSNRMREHLTCVFENEINPFYARLTPEELKQLDGKDAGDQPWSISLFLYMSYWFASLNAVIEGWRQLKLCDDDVDRLLDKSRVARLKRYRDAVMHFRPQYMEERVQVVFAEVTEFVPWAHALHDAFSAYFLRRLVHKHFGNKSLE